MADLLAERGDLEGLRTLNDVGWPGADFYLPRLLDKQGRGEEAERLRDSASTPDGSIARS